MLYVNLKDKKNIKTAVKNIYKRIYGCFNELWINKPGRFCLILSFVLNLFIEVLARRSVADTLTFLLSSLTIFVLDTLILFLCFSIALISVRRGLWVLLVSVIWMILGITNFIMLGIRTTPFSASDIQVLISCLPIVKRYVEIWQLVLIGAAFVGIIYFFIVYFKKTKKYSRVIWKQITNIVFIGVILAVGLIYCNRLNILSLKFPSIVEAYNDYGFSYCFSASVFSRGIHKPDSYSAEVINEIVNETESSIIDENNKRHKSYVNTQDEDFKPNIVFLQLESFFDVNRLKNITFSENPVPVFSNLKNRYSSGYLSVPSIGAGTANVEFEVLSGMSLDYFGAGEYPYNTILRTSTCETIGNNLRGLGYTAHAIHNNFGTFYNRNEVFSSLGFDTFTSLEYMEKVQYNPIGWAKDSCLIPSIRDCLRSTDDVDFIYAISVQGHGNYPEDEVESESFDEKTRTKRGHSVGKVDDVLTQAELDAQTIRVSGFDDPDTCAKWNYYVNEINEIDVFLGTLLAELQNEDEPVVLVIYGDHLPSLSIENDMLNDDSSVLQSEYVIWSNFDMEKTDEDLEAYQLSAVVLDYLNIHEGVLTPFHQTERYSAEYQDSLALLEYDILYGDKISLGRNGSYPFTDLHMGVNFIDIWSVDEFGGSLYISGKNFTDFSVVILNGENVNTQFLSAGMLRIPNIQLKSGDIVEVAQIGDTDYILSKTAPYIIQ